MRETSKRRLQGMAHGKRRRKCALLVERLEGRLTLSHTPMTPSDQAIAFEPESHDPYVGASYGAAAAEYASPSTSYLGVPRSMMGGPGPPVTQSSDNFSSQHAFSGPGGQYGEANPRFETSSAGYSSTDYATFAPVAKPSVQLALIIPNSGQFDPLLVVIVDHTIVGVVQPVSMRGPSASSMDAMDSDYGHPESNAPPSKPPAPSAQGGPRSAPPSSVSVVLPASGDSHSASESAAAHENHPLGGPLAAGLGVALGGSASAGQANLAIPSPSIPGTSRSDVAATPWFGLLVPPSDSAPMLRERAPAVNDVERSVEAEVASATSEAETTAPSAVDSSAPLVEMGQTAAMLDGIGLRIDAVDQALEGALAEIERLGGDLASWLSEFGLGSWSVSSGTAAALGVGAYFGLRGARCAADEDHEEESSSWLFSRLQTPTGSA